MRAMVMRDYGGPEVFEMQDVPQPRPTANDLLIEVRCSALNPVDTKTRMAPRWGDRKPPFVLGFDVSGVVKAVGENVSGFGVGDEVYASPGLARDGSNAEFVCVDYRTAAMKPTSVDHAHAAALPLVTLTAWESLHVHAGIQAGETVLIHAGAGGVGHVAVQLAKLAGCRVITTASQDESIKLCNELGADVVINHGQEDFVERVMQETDGAGCPVVFDTVGTHVFEKSLDCVAVHGRLVTIVPGIPTDRLNELFRKNASLHFEFMGARVMSQSNMEWQGDVLKQMATLVDEGKVRPRVHSRLPLEQVPEAHVQQQTGRTIGKIVFEVS